ncbi:MULTISPECIES: LytR/AlgR family response regulator transcription factor [unclassified Colwellia]|uniref:LytR/AlgR family response regulator transcription factor n=1 Tax=unclassified Colwellia TaxID=196834 RepID=UPI0015F757E7|nr:MULTISPECIES: LytTR family DNA-binding domain-containing protein [unclassified Colwellia]MBA6231126.1 LytTR family transcriptional regulator [Colwellia sp. MB02u-7]MBA6235105.1 LytTR family transcriptional regulator [Colwellia sp. MB02u-11]MBA6301686.1 LytTR family transcriptional regulator [Colwellia sp. MB3u-22]MBA6309340.1 LytTR family transcriptional regulator [Colwellia sp. MB3u-64]
MNKLHHFQKYKFHYEVLGIFGYLFINSVILATSVIMEANRSGVPSFQLWEPFVWEFSSAIATILLLPACVWLLKKHPFNWSKVTFSLGMYFISSIIFSIVHVSVMVTIREVIYWTQSLNYDFGNILIEFIYELRKDIWGFISILIVIKGYGFILSRLQGEACPIAIGEENITQRFDRLLVKKLGKEFIVKVEDIEWLESSGNYVNLHSKGRIYPTRTTLTQLISQIEEQGFCRIHRSYAVNLNNIDSITPLSSGDSEVKLNNGKILNLSRRYKDAFKSKLL